MKTYRNNITYISIIFIMLTTIGCQKKQSEIEEIAFNVNFDIMESPVRDSELKLGYALPKNFSELRLNSDSLAIFIADSTSLQINVKHLFKADSSSMIIALSTLDYTESRIQAILDAPDSLLNQNGYFDSVQVAQFRFNNFEKVHQIVQSNSQLVNFRIILKNSLDKFIQIDCVSSQADYLENLNLFESFFGLLYATT